VKRSVLGGLMFSGVLALAPAVCAQSETRAAVAEGLYRQARDLMLAGKYDEACPKFAESQRLDPATGTLLNLAACHEKQGKLATAWIEYSDALFAARRDGREDRVEYARGRAAELEPKLSRLTLQLDAGADHAGLEIELDGATLGRAVIGASMPIDPGQHTLRASAPGKKPWTQAIEIAALADQKVLSIPRLEDAPPEPVAPLSPVPGAAVPPLSAPPSDELSPRPVPTSVYLAGGITLALGVGAGVSGMAYLNKKAAYDDERPNGRSATLESLEDKAQRYGYLNLGLWAATAVGAGVTTYLYVTRPALPRAARVVPWATHQTAGLSVLGDF
jgi:tetratricopeptide (TPR) repeat protein